MRTNYSARFYESKGKLMFYLKVNSIADVGAAPFEFDNIASARHIKDYPAAYKEYLKSQQVHGNVIEQSIELPVE